MPPLIRIDVRVRQQEVRGAIATLNQYGRGAVRDVQAITVASGNRALRLARRFAPKDTHFMEQHIRLVLSARKLAYTIGYVEADFTGAGLAFYAIFQELGFIHWATGQFIQNPHLKPAHDVEHPRYYRDVATALRRRAQMMRAR